MDFVTSVLKIFGIVLLRFRPLPRVWNYWLVAVNLLCLTFIGHLEAQVVLGVTTLAVVIQALIYQRMGFVRLLGVAHLLWLPMFGWLATRYQGLAEYPELQVWLIVLAATNAVSYAIDSSDVCRFLKGEREPHYRWS